MQVGSGEWCENGQSGNGMCSVGCWQGMRGRGKKEGPSRAVWCEERKRVDETSLYEFSFAQITGNSLHFIYVHHAILTPYLIRKYKKKQEIHSTNS